MSMLLAGLPALINSPKNDDSNDPLHKLFRTPKHVPKSKPDNNHALISELSSHTLKWIKRRRSANTEKKVVLSHETERQLREMFNSLDFNNEGTISLKQLAEAITYVQGKSRGSRGMEAFQNLGSVFKNMDDNGDGSISFQEFTHGMTGTSSSAFEKASVHDLDKLFSFFVEFGECKQREYARRKISEAGQSSKQLETLLTTNRSRQSHDSTSSKQSSRKYSEAGFNADISCYQGFKSLFGNEDALQSRRSLESTSKRFKHLAKLLEDFTNCTIIEGQEEAVTTASAGVSGDAQASKDTGPQATEDRLKELRRQQIEVQLSSPLIHPFTALLTTACL